MFNSYRINLKAAITLCGLLLGSCLEPYDAPNSDPVDFLVVDGFLNTTKGEVEVRLTHAKELSSKTNFLPELKAMVTLESETGNSIEITEKGQGNYFRNGIVADMSKKYRLHIKTTGNKEYLSGYVELIKSPPLDNVVWEGAEDGVKIKVNAHGDDQSTRYYQWRFEETWKYSATHFSNYLIKNKQAVSRIPDEFIYYCYKAQPSTQILITSSERLSNDVIHDFQIHFIPFLSQKISDKYSILVKQNSISREAYDFWSKLEQTTESIGGLFDPQPGKVIGNIYSVSDSQEPVLGFFEGGTVEEKRLFISRFDLPEHLQILAMKPSCDLDTVSLADVSKLSNSYNLINQVYDGPSLVGYTYASVSCSDCRKEGGTITKPFFWEE